MDEKVIAHANYPIYSDKLDGKAKVLVLSYPVVGKNIGIETQADIDIYSRILDSGDIELVIRIDNVINKYYKNENGKQTFLAEDKGGYATEVSTKFKIFDHKMGTIIKEILAYGKIDKKLKYPYKLKKLFERYISQISSDTISYYNCRNIVMKHVYEFTRTALLYITSSMNTIYHEELKSKDKEKPVSLYPVFDNLECMYEFKNF